MNWSAFAYLAGVTLAAVILIFLAVKAMPRLTTPSKARTKEELFLLGVVVVLGLISIYGLFYTERLYWAYATGDIGSDTIEQYVPFYANLIGNVRNGSLSTWSFEYELGVNNPGYQSWIYDPFNLIVVPLGLLLGDAHLSFVLVISQSIKLILSAFLFDHLLTRFCETPLARILGALLYAFSGFMVLYGQHYWFGSAFPIFTLTLLMFELYLEKRTVLRFLGVTLSVGLLMIWTVYVSFMVLLFAVFYLLLRIPTHLSKPSVKAYLLTVGRLCLPVLCGVLLAGITFVPYVMFLLTETSRTSAEASLGERVAESITSFVRLSWIPAILSRFLGSSLINSGFNSDTPCVPGAWDIGGFTYEFIMMGYSSLAFILVGQFLHYIFTEEPKRTRVLVSIGTLLIVLYCFNNFLPTLFTAMVRVQYRSSFVLALPVCVAMAIGFEKRIMTRHVAKVPLAITAVFTLGVLVWSLVNTVNGRLVCLYFIAVLIFATAIMWALPHVNSTRVCAVLLILLLGSTVSTSIVDGLFSTNCRRTVDAGAFPLSGKSDIDKNTVDALNWIQSQDSSFYRVDKTYPDWSPLNDSLIQHYDGASAYNSTPDSDVDEFYNKLWKEAITTYVVYSQGTRNAPDSKDVLSFLNVKYILSKYEMITDWLELEKTFGDVYVYRNTSADSIVTVCGFMVPESVIDSLESSEQRAQFLADTAIISDELYYSIDSINEATSEPTSSFNKLSETELEGTISCSDTSIAVAAIPNTGNWIVEVDGEEVPTMRANYGFIGFRVAAGEHTVRMHYVLAGFSTGLILTFVGVILTAIMAIAISVMGKQAKKQLGAHMAKTEE